MNLGKYSLFYFIIFLIIKSNSSFSETIQTNNNFNSLPSTFEEVELSKEEENFFEKNNIKVKFNNEKIDKYKEPTIEIKALDKISAKTTILKIKIGEEINFEKLKIKPLKCKNSEFDDSPDTIAYLQVRDITQKDNDKVFVFNGWTFASSPSLRPFDHAVYDLWLVRCYNV